MGAHGSKFKGAITQRIKPLSLLHCYGRKSFCFCTIWLSHNHYAMPIMCLLSFLYLMLRFSCSYSVPIPALSMYVCMCVHKKSTDNLSILLASKSFHQEEPQANLMEKTTFHPKRLDLELNAVSGWNFGQKKQGVKENLMSRRIYYYRAFYYSLKIWVPQPPLQLGGDQFTNFSQWNLHGDSAKHFQNWPLKTLGMILGLPW